MTPNEKILRWTPQRGIEWGSAKPKNIPGSTGPNRQDFISQREEPVMITSKFQGAMWRRIAVGVLGLGAFLLLPCSSIAAGSSNKPVTFAKDVAPIFQAKCQECHHPGSVAPMSLVTYEETRPWADKIKDRVISRNMPPWHLDRTVGIQHFKNDTSLTDEQIDTIVRWVDSGTPAGSPKDMPPAKQWPSDEGWQLAE